MALNTPAEDILATMPTLLQSLAPNSATVTYDSADYAGTKTRLSRDLVYGEFGYGDDYDFSVRLLESDLTAGADNPVADEKVTVSGIVYRILDTETDAVGATRTLHLGDEDA